MRVTRDDKSPFRLAKRWVGRQVGRLRAAIAPRLSLLGFAEFQVLVAGLRLGLFELLGDNARAHGGGDQRPSGGTAVRW